MHAHAYAYARMRNTCVPTHASRYTCKRAQAHVHMKEMRGHTHTCASAYKCPHTRTRINMHITRARMQRCRKGGHCVQRPNAQRTNATAAAHTGGREGRRSGRGRRHRSGVCARGTAACRRPRRCRRRPAARTGIAFPPNSYHVACHVRHKLRNNAEHATQPRNTWHHKQPNRDADMLLAVVIVATVRMLQRCNAQHSHMEYTDGEHATPPTDA